MPNFTTFLWNILNREKKIKVIIPEAGLQNQTIKNLAVFEALSDKYGYQFIPVLQPCLGAGNYINAYEEYQLKDSAQADNFLHGYNLHKKSYRDFFEASDTAQVFYYDFTRVFSGIREYPFIDDCHVRANYQHIISDSIFEILRKRH